MSSDIQRKLTTILAADAAGYSRVMEHNEEQGLRALKAARAVFKKFIARHYGRVANTAGDGLIAEFPSVVEAVQCAIEVQRELGDTQNDPDTALNFRIGIHLGDVMVDGDDLLGEGVNLAARLQTMAEPGGILISRQVYDQVHSKLSVGFDYLGEKHPRNFSEGVQVYGITTLDSPAPTALREPTVETYRPASPPPQPETPRTAPAQGRGDTPDASPPPATAKDVLLSRLKPIGIAILALCLIDAFSGRGLWAQYPVLVLLTLAGLHAAPQLANDRLSVTQLRGLMIAGFLVLMNLFTWSGYFWAMWPVGAMIVLGLARQTTKGRT